MSRQKKSRKPSPLAPKQKPRLKKSELDAQDKKVKKPKGRKPGSRNNPLTKPSSKKTVATNNDPRHGSKKPIALDPVVAEPVVTPDFKPQVKLKKVSQQSELTPEQELEQIENDQRLNELLDRSESGEVLTGKDAKYFNAKTARHSELMDILGLEYGDDEDDWDDEDWEDDDEFAHNPSIIEQWENDDGDEQ